MVLVQKWPFFQLFFFGKIGHENVFYDIVERKNPFLGYKNKKCKKSKNYIFLKGLIHGFWTKMSFFGTSVFYGKIGQENVFDHILEQKNAFLGSKNQKVKKSKNWHFSKGVNPWFRSKNDHFSNFFFLGKIGQENVFYDILERKNTFLGYKNKKFKKSKNCIILKGLIHGFWTKMSFFRTSVFYGNIGQENVFDHILEQKKRLSSL